MKIAVILVALLAIVGGGVFVLTSNNDKNTSDNKTSNQTAADDTPAKSSSSPSTSAEASEENVITYSSDGFSPASLTVKAGSKVTVKNTSSQSLQFESDPHPQHTDDPELNVGIVSPGESKTVTVTKTGSHGFHNHFNPGHTGTLVVN